MYKDIAEQWVTALRSGKFKQGSGFLRVGDEYCCLGVLCELYRRDQQKETEEAPDWKASDSDYNPSVQRFIYTTVDLPSEVVEWAGMNSDIGEVALRPQDFYSLDEDIRRNLTTDGENLAILNDGGATFEQLADIIEKYREDI